MQNLHQSYYLDKLIFRTKVMKIIQSFILMKLFFSIIAQARDKKSIKNEITFIITNIKVTL